MSASPQDPHPAERDPDDLLRECDVRRVRRSGPGGQRRNKVETGVHLRHRPTGVEAEAAERRSQSENQRAALNRLRTQLALDVRQPGAVRAAPSPLWKSRCRNGRISVNRRHADFPALLAEALDVLLIERCDPKAAASRLGCSPSQLIKLLKAEPKALSLINGKREERGLHRLK